MSIETNVLRMQFLGNVVGRRIFLQQIRIAVTRFTGERMTLDSLINEIAKNIFDHAQGMGFLTITRRNNSFKFMIKDAGQDTYDFSKCVNHSALAGNGVNFGVGLKMIRECAEALKIDLHIDTSKGFTYSGIYRPRKQFVSSAKN